MKFIVLLLVVLVAVSAKPRSHHTHAPGDDEATHGPDHSDHTHGPGHSATDGHAGAAEGHHGSTHGHHHGTPEPGFGHSDHSHGSGLIGGGDHDYRHHGHTNGHTGGHHASTDAPESGNDDSTGEPGSATGGSGLIGGGDHDHQQHGHTNGHTGGHDHHQSTNSPQRRHRHANEGDHDHDHGKVGDKGKIGLAYKKHGHPDFRVPASAGCSSDVNKCVPKVHKHAIKCMAIMNNTKGLQIAACKSNSPELPDAEKAWHEASGQWHQYSLSCLNAEAPPTPTPDAEADTFFLRRKKRSFQKRHADGDSEEKDDDDSASGEAQNAHSCWVSVRAEKEACAEKILTCPKLAKCQGLGPAPEDANELAWYNLIKERRESLSTLFRDYKAKIHACLGEDEHGNPIPTPAF